MRIIASLLGLVPLMAFFSPSPVGGTLYDFERKIASSEQREEKSEAADYSSA